MSGRFAPSTTGQAHPGTLLAALLCWLDARSRGDRVIMRLEDLDPERCTPAFGNAICDAVAWLGLEWDAIEWQSAARERHEAALDVLAARGLLYPSSVSRRELAEAGQRAPDGGWAYDNRDRGRSLPIAGWRSSDEPLRVQLSDDHITLHDASGLDLSQAPTRAFGDPIVRRRDGAIAYHLASVVDDAAGGITHVVRGRDLAASTATQVALQRVLGYKTPIYRHHVLLLEARDQKLAKFHGAVGWDRLRQIYDAPSLLGILAVAAGLRTTSAPVTVPELLAEFSWSRVRTHDIELHWDGSTLRLGAEVTDG